MMRTMKFLKGLSIIALIATLTACGGLSRKETGKWLDSKNQPALVNVTGEWDSSESLSGGWGWGRFQQDGNSFSGTLGKYYVDGTVSGEEIYMVLYVGDTIYYTAMLKKSEEDIFMGKAVYETLADHKDARRAQSYLMTLKRVKR